MVEEWKIGTIEANGIEVIDGDRGESYPSGTDFADDGYCLFLNAKNVTKTGFAFDECQFILQEKHEKLRNGHLNRDDIVLTTRGTVGNIAHYSGDIPFDCIRINSGMVIIRNQNHGLFNTEFLYALFRSHIIRKQIEALAFGSAQSQLTVKIIKQLKVPIPPLSEQRKIAEILRTWDEAIEKLEVLIDRVKRQHLALTHSLIFGSRRLPRFKKSNDLTAHRRFALPREWDCQPIGKLAIEVSERNGNREAFEVLSCSKYDGFIRSLEYFKKQVFSSDLTGYKKIWRGDFGFPSNHVEEGSIGLQDLVDVGIVSPIYTVFRFAPEKIDRVFAFSVLKTSLYRHIFEVSTSASVDRRGSLRWKEFAEIPFPVPPRPEQEAISEVLAVHSRKLTDLENQRDTYARQKRGLMQKLLTGEWRVNTTDFCHPDLRGRK